MPEKSSLNQLIGHRNLYQRRRVFHIELSEHVLPVSIDRGSIEK